MHSHDNVVRGNRYQQNAVGVFVMYSRGIEIEDNFFLDAFGASGLGIGIKDSGNVEVRGNTFVRNSAAIYVDNSPVAIDERNVLEGNAFRLGRAGLLFHGRARGNEIRGNAFSSNRDHVVVEGGGDALDAEWAGNHFDDYAGYDLDGDGTGDVPYEVRSLSSELSGTHPAVQYFRGTASFGVVDALGKLVPLFSPRVLMRDERPAVSDPVGEPEEAS
jgi:nitrous oxidase accessory protein